MYIGVIVVARILRVEYSTPGISTDTCIDISTDTSIDFGADTSINIGIGIGASLLMIIVCFL